MPEGKDTTRTEGRQVVYCAGVGWIRMTCGILFQGRDRNWKGSNPTILNGVSFLQQGLECTEYWRSREASERQAVFAKREGL